MRNKNEMLDEMIEFVESIILRELEPEEIDYIRTNGDEKFLETLDVYGCDVDAIIDLRNILSAYITETEDDKTYWDYLESTNPEAIEIMRNIVAEYDELHSDDEIDEDDDDENEDEENHDEECPCNENYGVCCKEEDESCTCGSDNNHVEEALINAVDVMLEGESITCSEKDFDILSDFISKNYVNFILRYEDGEASMKIVK